MKRKKKFMRRKSRNLCHINMRLSLFTNKNRFYRCKNRANQLFRTSFSFFFCQIDYFIIKVYTYFLFTIVHLSRLVLRNFSLHNSRNSLKSRGKKLVSNRKSTLPYLRDGPNYTYLSAEFSVQVTRKICLLPKWIPSRTIPSTINLTNFLQRISNDIIHNTKYCVISQR